MEPALAAKALTTPRALTRIVRQLVLLVAITYGTAYIVQFCFSFDSSKEDEPQSSTLLRGSRFNLHAELACDSASTRLWEGPACNLLK
jgi:hypothetical protein